MFIFRLSFGIHPGNKMKAKTANIPSHLQPSRRFRIQCRSSSHGRPLRRPSIETGQPIPVVGHIYCKPQTSLPFPSFFPTKTTGEWTTAEQQQPAPLLLSRSRINPDLLAELAVAQSPVLGRRRRSREEQPPTPAIAPKEAAQPKANAVMVDYERMRPRPRLVLGTRGSALGQYVF